jgi:hypothetical protein
MNYLTILLLSIGGFFIGRIAAKTKTVKDIVNACIGLSIGVAIGKISVFVITGKMITFLDIALVITLFIIIIFIILGYVINRS